MICTPFDVIGPGTPFWSGPPYQPRIVRIHSLTHVDESGVLYAKICGRLEEMPIPERL